MNRATKLLLALLGALALCVGCEHAPSSTGPEQAGTQTPELDRLLSEPVPARLYAAPGPLAAVQVGSRTLNFWPYTGENFSGQGQDPINLVFVGKADPRDIRAALLALDGDRTAFGLPADPPFNARWDDAIGDVQTGYGEQEGWTGGAIQLACGDYGPVRFHLRLFRMGDYTVGNVHFELLIPGTATHQVLSWEVAEQFVVADFLRSGLLDPSAPVLTTGVINEPNFRTIPAQIYNLLPPTVKGLIGGPQGDVSTDVPIGSDGVATVLQLASGANWKPESRIQDLTIHFNQTIPKPFCSSGPYDYVYVTGDVALHQTTSLSSMGDYRMSFVAEGTLQVQPVNPLTGEAIGRPMTAVVAENHAARMDGTHSTASSWLYQQLSPVTDPAAGLLFKRLLVGDPGGNCFREIETCAKALAAGE